MELPFADFLYQDIFKRPKSEEQILAAKKLGNEPEILQNLSQTQELFDSCVPNRDATYEQCTEVQVTHTELHDQETKTPEEDRTVPTLDDDDSDAETDFLENSILKSPVTPGPELFANDESLGFENLQSLNIITPVESTQACMELLRQKNSPIKRSCLRDEPIESTQKFFDLSRQYKALSCERKKSIFDGQTLNEDGIFERSPTRPLRRKLFRDTNEEMYKDDGKKFSVTKKEDFELESFDDAWEKVTSLNLRKSNLIVRPYPVNHSKLDSCEKATHSEPDSCENLTSSEPDSCEKVTHLELDLSDRVTEETAYKTPVQKVTIGGDDKAEISVKESAELQKAKETPSVPGCAETQNISIIKEILEGEILSDEYDFTIVKDIPDFREKEIDVAIVQDIAHVQEVASFEEIDEIQQLTKTQEIAELIEVQNITESPKNKMVSASSKEVQNIAESPINKMVSVSSKEVQNITESPKNLMVLASSKEVQNITKFPKNKMVSASTKEFQNIKESPNKKVVSASSKEVEEVAALVEISHFTEVTTTDTKTLNTIPQRLNQSDHTTVESKGQDNANEGHKICDIVLQTITFEEDQSLQRPSKRMLSTKALFDPENRIYKRMKVDDQAVNCPELVTELFRTTGHPAAGFPSYPPAITRVVPIPVPDEPVRKRSGGLARRSARSSLHPYISRNPGQFVNEE